MLPSHASMMHGELANHPMEIYSTSGVCLTSLQALKICYAHVLSGLHKSAICVASELTSPSLCSKFYDPEYEATHENPNKDPYMAFEKDFLRFMLSDGAGAVLLDDKPGKGLELENKYPDYKDLYRWVIKPAYDELYEAADCWFEFAEVYKEGEKTPFKLNFKVIKGGCTVGIIIHEIGHAIGLLHEQCRFDRDTHITVYMNNIKPEYQHNFTKEQLIIIVLVHLTLIQ